ncbi:DUF4138 domain-containing protein [Pricia sp. S334]|uniref:DUF4138 domain-containing protein n=1 Tax=Pricia mediterranea TaxID=3076079 RepID=A0ABU3LA11_9FLAO|nr:DUF4138 domain-containing protein [Pricia sp. S334]MDT7830505.1 DUF4138 domain-containing protein [Pricia sp. S334]
MKNSTIFFLLSVFFGAGCHGQEQHTVPISVMVNAHTTLTLFFPSPISRTIAPAANFEFKYDNDEPQMGLLSGNQGKSSNLTVITENGHIYSFAIEYSDSIEKFNFILSPEMAVGRLPNHTSKPEDNKQGEPGSKPRIEMGEVNDSASVEPVVTASNNPAEISSEVLPNKLEIPVQPGDAGIPLRASIADEEFHQKSKYNPKGLGHGEEDLYDVDRNEYYRIFCENNYLQKTIFLRTFRQNKRIVLKLNNILIDREEIYFVLQIENNSRKEYHVNGLSFFRKSGVGQLQKIMKPRYVFNLQDKIDPKGINEVVLVFNRFTISGKEEVYVVLDELDTNRMVLLPLDNKQINAPTN